MGDCDLTGGAGPSFFSRGKNFGGRFGLENI